MSTEIGEYLVGAYLELIEGYEVVSYNQKFPGEGKESQNELDVIGFNFQESKVILCEVATHILGFLYGGRDSIEVMKKKVENQKNYVERHLKNFKNIEFEFWSPRVSKKMIEGLEQIEGLELVINQKYTYRINKLREKAKKITKRIGNPAFRMLQILEHLKK